jgi:hypothetical protein
MDLIRYRLNEKDSLIQVLSDQTYHLKTNNEILSTTLDANGNIFDGLSTYFTIISILLSIIVVAIPILNYFIVLKPNKETIKRLENLEIEIPQKIENDFGKYLEGFEKRKAKSLIKSLTDPSNLKQVVNFFFLSTFSDFDDEDQNIVVSFLENNREIEESDRRILTYILSYRVSLISESFFKKVIENMDPLDYIYAIEYLTDNTPEKYIKFWELVITASPKGHHILLDIFNHLLRNYVGSPVDKKSPDKVTFGKKTIELFFDNEAICNAIENQKLSKHKVINGTILGWNPFIKDTTYYKRFFNENGKMHDHLLIG